MRHPRNRLEDPLPVIDLSSIDDDRGVPDALDEFTGERKTQLSGETAAKVVDVEQDFGHGGWWRRRSDGKCRRWRNTILPYSISILRL